MHLISSENGKDDPLHRYNRAKHGRLLEGTNGMQQTASQPLPHLLDPGRPIRNVAGVVENRIAQQYDMAHGGAPFVWMGVKPARAMQAICCEPDAPAPDARAAPSLARPAHVISAARDTAPY